MDFQAELLNALHGITAALQALTEQTAANGQALADMQEDLAFIADNSTEISLSLDGIEKALDGGLTVYN